MRLMECCTLRVKDLDLGGKVIIVRDGKGSKDRVTMVPGVLVSKLRRTLKVVKCQRAADLSNGAGWVALPTAFERKSPNAGREWPWQCHRAWVFPATRIYRHSESGQRRRHHLHETVLQRAVREVSARRRDGQGSLSG